MKKAIAVILMVILMSGLAACTQTVSAGTVQSDKPRLTTPAASETDLGAVVRGNTDFSLDLYQVLRKDDGNLFYSPYSISLALAMAYAGAQGETEQQMADTLHFGLPQNQLHPALNDLALKLASRGQGAKGKDGEGFRLHIVNAMWGQKDFQFLSGFLDTLAENYGAGIRLLDFAKQPEQSRLTINDWVSDQTEKRINDLIPSGAIDELTRLVLTNAIYFNAAWQHPFDSQATSDGDFYLLDGGKMTVPMMRETESLGYAAGDGYQAIELPYDGNELSMVVLLPDSGGFDTFGSSLTSEKLNGIINQLNSTQISLTLPKFEFDSSFSLKDTLSAMGMPVAFSDDADFSGMTGNRELTITDVVHKAFVSVDEAGTEAAAATAVIMAPTCMPASPIEVTVDRPFVFLIRDIQTGTILFVGRVVNPSK